MSGEVSQVPALLPYDIPIPVHILSGYHRTDYPRFLVQQPECGGAHEFGDVGQSITPYLWCRGWLKLPPFVVCSMPPGISGLPLVFRVAHGLEFCLVILDSPDGIYPFPLMLLPVILAAHPVIPFG